jgi:uncharacterized GH25 family protein
MSAKTVNRDRHVYASSTIFVLLVMVPVLPALAHFPWLIPDQNAPVLIYDVRIGHSLPSDQTLEPERIEAAALISPDGRVHSVTYEASGWQNEVATDGTYVLAAKQVSGYRSRTVEGEQAGSRHDHPQALSCNRSYNTMKAVVALGGGPADVGQPVGYELELVPQGNPANLRAGEMLPVQVLFHGEPWQGTVYATYEGYEAKGEDDHPVTVTTDARGVADLILPVSGVWMLRATVREDYPDTAVCDRRTFNSTLTFRIP